MSGPPTGKIAAIVETGLDHVVAGGVATFWFGDPTRREQLRGAVLRAASRRSLVVTTEAQGYRGSLRVRLSDGRSWGEFDAAQNEE